MKAMILAAGGGTRLHPLTHTLPKPMAPIANIPVMEHIIELLARHGFQDLVINLYHLKHFISDHFGDGSKWNVRITYSHEDELWGTAGGVKKVERFFDESFLVIGGDDLTDCDLTAAMQFHRERKALATIALTEVDDPSLYGVVVIDADGRIQQFQEKPKAEEAKSHLVNTGVYFFEPAIFQHIPAATFYDFGKQVFPDLVARGLPFYGCRLNGYWCDVGDLVQYRQAHRDVLGGQARVRVPGHLMKPGVWVEDGAQVDADAVIDGPALIGSGCQVAGGTRLQGMVVLGAGTSVGRNTRLHDCILWDRCDIGEACDLDGVVLGSRCVVRAGSRIKGTVHGAESDLAIASEVSRS